LCSLSDPPCLANNSLGQIWTSRLRSRRERRSAAKDRTALRVFSAVLTENDVQEVFDLTRSEPVLVHKTLGSILQPTLS
jgi:hypothetical protein